MPEPTKIPRPFADSGDKNTIPDSSGNIGFASWQEGFPAITSEPFSQGGVAPKRADFNGIFNALSAATLWYQQGGVYAYNNATDYEIGNVVLYSGNLYKCLAANGPSSTVKAPTDTATWDRIATASGFLPLSGGTLTGWLQFNPSDGNGRLQNNLTTYDGSIGIYGGAGYTSGAYARLYGKSHSSYPGAFFLTATDGTNTSTLNGKPDGSLTWRGNDIPTVGTGTWTPVLFGGTTAGTFTYTAQSGTYIKVNKLVYVEFSIACKVTTVPTGYLNVSGLPYVASTANQSILLNIGPGNNITNLSPLMFRTSTSGNLTLYGLNSSTNNSTPAAFSSSVVVGTEIAVRGNGIYRTA